MANLGGCRKQGGRGGQGSHDSFTNSGILARDHPFRACFPRHNAAACMVAAALSL